MPNYFAFKKIPKTFVLPPEGSTSKVNNASTLQFKTKYMFAFKTI